MTTTRIKTWMCSRCGYVMDAMDPALGEGVPKQGDICVCMNCGSPYILDQGICRPMTDAEFAGLEPEERRELAMAQLALKRVEADLGPVDKSHIIRRN